MLENRRRIIATFLSFFLASHAMWRAANTRADVRLAGVFADHMVLQRDVPLPVWGRADAGESITVQIAQRTEKTTADKDGRWRVDLKPLIPSTEPTTLTVRGAKNEIVIRDILVGDVWLASGQSNMQYSLKGTHDAADALAKANRPLLRLCSVGNKASLKPMDDRELKWSVCTRETARSFSGVAYHFGREVSDLEKVPVGLIGAYVSGTPAQSWANLEALESSPKLRHYLDDLRTDPPSTNPSGVNGGTPTALYNGMIAPLQPFAIRGVIWYQGESNTDRADEYRTLFPALITGWRRQWGERNFPFLFVQLPGFHEREPEPSPSKWAMLREAQTAALQLQNTGMAVTLDLVPQRAILHPKNKSGVGHRLALLAEVYAYGREIPCEGPTFESMRAQDDGSIRVRFKNVGGGLKIAAPPEDRSANQPTTMPSAVKGFSIAGADHHFVWADATIDGPDTVIVRSDRVPSPVAVRYGWAENPEVNVYNSDGLPMAPFRSDDWPE